MRAGKLDKAGDISVKVGKLLTDRRVQMWADLNDRDTRQLWAAVNTFRNRSVCNSLSHYGDRFADANAINEHFVEIATDPSYDCQQIKNFIKTILKKTKYPKSNSLSMTLLVLSGLSNHISRC
jgi:hypothetical protein